MSEDGNDRKDRYSSYFQYTNFRIKRAFVFKKRRKVTRSQKLENLVTTIFQFRKYVDMFHTWHVDAMQSDKIQSTQLFMVDV